LPCPLALPVSRHPWYYHLAIEQCGIVCFAVDNLPPIACSNFVERHFPAIVNPSQIAEAEFKKN